MPNISLIRAIGGLTFDATFKESHESELIVTDNPVESGVLVTDHAYMSPLKLTIRAGVSNTPLRTPNNDQFSSNISRRARAYELLTKLQAAAEPFDVQTGLKLYKNMVCLNIRTEEDKDSANVLDFVAELREVIIVNTQQVMYPARKQGKTTRQGSKTSNKGEKSPIAIEQTNTPKDITKKPTSLAKKLKAALGK